MNLRFNRRRIQKDLRFLRSLLLEQLPEKSTTLFRTVTQSALRVVTFLIPLLVTISLTIVVYMVGFEDVYQRHINTYTAHRFIFALLSILFIVRLLLLLPKVGRWRVRIFNFALLLLIFYLRDLAGEIPQLAIGSIELITKKLILFAGVVILFFIEVSHILRFVYRRGVNPAMLFVASFAAFIVLGGFLLLLPNATTGSIHPIDALFMSASAVCVTGLTVLDTATGFTPTGQVIILILIQLGGLGIMTFAGMISFLVTGSISIQSQVALQGMLSSNRMSNVISFISRIVLVTFTFEGIGAIMIYSTLAPDMFDSESRKIFFSIFHSVSAFCNAGFSTLSTGLYDVRLRHNYNLQWVIGLLVILGGMGFPILFNIFVSFRVKIRNTINRIFHFGEHENYTNVLDATSRLALATYFILLTMGFVAYFIFEFNHTLREHQSVMGIITTSFFGSVTPRTAGFGTVDFALFSLPTIMIYLLLMLVGASPGSTGGGIKTTVAAVAFLNMKSVVLGHERTEAFRSEISTASVKRAFAIILLA
ncbi:MAG: ATPase, partial [Bacteroidota bacterium]|nr:ATPase [Bacteroidota bacterium]